MCVSDADCIYWCEVCGELVLNLIIIACVVCSHWRHGNSVCIGAMVAEGSGARRYARSHSSCRSQGAVLFAVLDPELLPKPRCAVTSSSVAAAEGHRWTIRSRHHHRGPHVRAPGVLHAQWFVWRHDLFEPVRTNHHVTPRSFFFSVPWPAAAATACLAQMPRVHVGWMGGCRLAQFLTCSTCVCF